MTTQYHRVWQTWVIRRPATNETTEVDVAGSHPQTNSLADFRYKMQMARVNRGWSIQDVSERVQYDPSLLAAFERGEDVVPVEVQSSLARCLKIG